MAKTNKRRATKCLVSTIYVSIMLLVLFIIIFVAIPFIFKYKVEFQRKLVFPISDVPGRNFSNPKHYRLNGTRNFYVNVNVKDNVTVGVWHVLPENLTDFTLKPEDYENELETGEYPVVIFLHGNNNARTENIRIYGVLRKYFHVIAYDYRGYGDSTEATLNEVNVVSDTVALYRWLEKRTKAKIFFWGHSLGSGVATSTVARLHTEDVRQPSGLILEAPFASVIDVVRASKLVQMFSWLPWFESTVIEPFKKGFAFNSTKHILAVDCPVMLLHARDDSVIHYRNSEKLFQAAKTYRHPNQGDVLYYLFEAKGYGHMYIYKALDLPSYIVNFINLCIEHEKGKSGIHTI